MFMATVSAFIYNNQEVPMDDFGKFQPYRAADDKIVIITFGLKFFFFFFFFFQGVFWSLEQCFKFVVSFKLRFFKFNLLCLVDK